MSIVETEPISAVFYGGPGAGKTRVLASSMFDFKTGKVIRKGRLLQFGRERNISVTRRLPPEMIKRFVSPVDQPDKFVGDFSAWLMAAYRAAKKGDGLEVIALDGWTEFDVLFNQVKTTEGAMLKHFGRVKDSFIQAFEMLDPELMHAHILSTARVDEWKKAITKADGDELVRSDPDWMDYRYFPAASGWAKKNLSHYNDFVIYVDQDRGLKMVDGKAKQGFVHKYYMLPDGDFWVKNSLEEEWINAKAPVYLTDPTFDDILRHVETVGAGAHAVSQPSN